MEAQPTDRGRCAAGAIERIGQPDWLNAWLKNSIKNSMDIEQSMNELGQRARAASRAMARASSAAKNQALDAIAHALERDAAHLKAANARDVARATENGMDAAFIDR